MMSADSEVINEESLRQVVLLKTLIQDQRLNELSDVIKDKDIIMCLGNTKSGKSTIINYLIGNKLRASKAGRYLNYKRADEETLVRGPTIGHSAVSQTTIPSVWYTSGHGLIVDCPGFDDNRGEAQDIANAFYIKLLITQANSAKFLLVSDINDILRDDISQFISLVDTIYTILPIQSDTIFNSISIVFTKDKDDITVNELCNVLHATIIENPALRLLNRKFVSFLVKHPDHISIFPMPTKEGDILEGNKYIGSLEYSFQVDRRFLSNIKPGISSKSLCFAIETHNNSTDIIGFDQFSGQIKDNLFKILEDKPEGNYPDFVKSLENVISSNVQEKITEKLGKLSIIDSRIILQDDFKKMENKINFIEFMDDLLEMQHSKVFFTKLDIVIFQIIHKINQKIIMSRSNELQLSRDEYERIYKELESKKTQQILKYEEQLKMLERSNLESVEKKGRILGIPKYLKRISSQVTTFIGNQGNNSTEDVSSSTINRKAKGLNHVYVDITSSSEQDENDPILERSTQNSPTSYQNRTRNKNKICKCICCVVMGFIYVFKWMCRCCFSIFSRFSR